MVESDTDVLNVLRSGIGIGLNQNIDIFLYFNFKEAFP